MLLCDEYDFSNDDSSLLDRIEVGELEKDAMEVDEYPSTKTFQSGLSSDDTTNATNAHPNAASQDSVALPIRTTDSVITGATTVDDPRSLTPSCSSDSGGGSGSTSAASSPRTEKSAAPTTSPPSSPFTATSSSSNATTIGAQLVGDACLPLAAIGLSHVFSASFKAVEYAKSEVETRAKNGLLYGVSLLPKAHSFVATNGNGNEVFNS